MLNFATPSRRGALMLRVPSPGVAVPWPPLPAPAGQFHLFLQTAGVCKFLTIVFKCLIKLPVSLTVSPVNHCP